MAGKTRPSPAEAGTKATVDVVITKEIDVGNGARGRGAEQEWRLCKVSRTPQAQHVKVTAPSD